MFVREQIAWGHPYLYLVESAREGKQLRQRTVRALGRKAILEASGEPDRLIASLARPSEQAMARPQRPGQRGCIVLDDTGDEGVAARPGGTGAQSTDRLDEGWVPNDLV